MKSMHPLAAAILAVWLLLIALGVVLAIFLGARSDDEERARARPTPTRQAVFEEDEQPFVPGNILGLRCSTASKFLRDRYGLDERKGCVILRASARSGAERAGLRIGDKILAVNGLEITSGRQFSHVFERQGATYAEFKVERDGETKDVDVRLGRYSDPPIDDPYYDYLVARGNPDPQTAIEYFSLQIKSDPNFDLAYAYRAEYLIDESSGVEDLSLSHGERDLREALRIDPELAEAHEIYASMLAWKLERYDDALGHIEQAIALSGCAPPLSPSDVDCGSILLTRAEIYLARNAEGDVGLIRQDIGTVANVEAVRDRAAGIASQADSNERELQRGAGRCVNEADIAIPCALWMGHDDWTLESLAEQEASTRMIMANIAGERMQETRFHLAQLIANQRGNLDEVIEQLTLAMNDAYCSERFEPVQCGKYVFARAQTYYVRGLPGDMALAEADFRVALETEQFHDEASKSLEFIQLGR